MTFRSWIKLFEKQPNTAFGQLALDIEKTLFSCRFLNRTEGLDYLKSQEASPECIETFMQAYSLYLNDRNVFRFGYGEKK